uniref:Uncharacterized protein n=1 Tax=Meloidogyne hapla TaxID=6305 RepID=A0A1I8AZV7_MELHA
MNLSAKYNRTANNVNRTQNLNFMHSNACRWLYVKVDKYKHDTDGQIKAKAATFGGFIGGLSLGWLLYYGESRNFVRPQMSDF